MFPIWVAWRYLFTNRKNSSTRRIIIVATITTAIGVTMPIMVLSIIHGFHDTIISGIIGRSFHIKVETDGLEMDKVEELKQRLTNIYLSPQEIQEELNSPFSFEGSADERIYPISFLAPYVESSALIESQFNTQAILFRGFEPSLMQNAKFMRYFHCSAGCVEYKSNSDEATSPDKGIFTFDIEQPGAIVLGQDLADRLMISKEMVESDHKPTVKVYSPKDPAVDHGQPNRRLFQVVGMFKSGLRDLDQSFAFMKINSAQKLRGIEELSGIGIEIINPELASLVRTKITSLIKDIFEKKFVDVFRRTKTYQKEHQNYLYALEWELVWVNIIMVVMILAAFLTIALTLFVVVSDKRKEIGILKAMGTSMVKIMSIFIINGLLITFVGMVLGILLGGLVIPPMLSGIVGGIETSIDEIRTMIVHLGWYETFGIELPLSTFNLVDSAIFQTDGIPFQVEFQDIFRIMALTVVIGFLFSLLPAIRAGRLDPVEVIRSE